MGNAKIPENSLAICGQKYEEFLIVICTMAESGISLKFWQVS